MLASAPTVAPAPNPNGGPLTADPQRVGDYLQHVATPATSNAYEHLAARLVGQPLPTGLALRVKACGAAMSEIDLGEIAWSLTEQRAQALAGRPRVSDASGIRSSSTTSSTEANGNELAYIREIGLALAEALDRIHPDPSWPAITTGKRARTSTATELLADVCGQAFGTLNPVQALDDLADAVDGLEAAVNDARSKARTAQRCRAWGARPSEVDPPDPVLESLRCTGWPKGTHNGEPVGCGNYVGEHAHHHPETGSEHHADICDDCYRLVCTVCWGAPRRTPGAKDCGTCSVRASRAARRAA